MTPQEAAAALDGNEYRKEGSKELFLKMAKAGLVAVYGASDDLMEFEGVIRDEVGVIDGGMAYLDRYGLLENSCEDEHCPYFGGLKEKATTIKAIWDDGGFSWRYETTIPHVKFVIKEDGDNYCEGIVFDLGDVK